MRSTSLKDRHQHAGEAQRDRKLPTREEVDLLTDAISRAAWGIEGIAVAIMVDADADCGMSDSSRCNLANALQCLGEFIEDRANGINQAFTLERKQASDGGATA